MRIGIFTDTYIPDLNGCAQSAYVLSNNLRSLGHDVFVVCSGSSLTTEKEDNIIRLPGVEIKKLYGYKVSSPIQPLYFEEIKNLNFDIIHAETEFGIGILANICSFMLHIPLVRTYHTDYVDYTHYYIPEDLSILYNGAHDIVSLLTQIYGDTCLRLMTPSEKTKKMLIETGIKTPINVVPNGIELARFNPELTSQDKIKEIRKEFNVSENEKLLIYVGRVADEKNIDVLLQTFKKVKEAKLKVKLVIVGFGVAYDKLVKLKDKLELNDTVIFAGKKPFEEVPSYYHASDGFISASTSETQGLTYIEALSSGLPIIVAYDDVLIDLVKEKVNGWFFKDIDTCFKVIEEFSKLTNEELVSIKKNCIDSTKIYDANKFAKDTLQIYEEIIKEYKESYIVNKTTLSDDIVFLHLINGMGDKLKVSIILDDYYNYGFRNNSRINIDTIKEIQKKETSALAYRSAIRRLAIKDHSVHQMKTSLKRKYDLSEEELNILINKLKENGLLDDEKYAMNRINYLSSTLLSLKAIRQKLISEGINKGIINKYLIEDVDEELEKVKRKASKYLLTIRGKSVNAKKQTILVKLVNDGFNSDTAKRAIEELDFSKDALLEDDLLKLEAEKAYLKYRKKYEGYELRNRIYNYLANKGFNLEAIYAVINEMEY